MTPEASYHGITRTIISATPIDTLTRHDQIKLAFHGEGRVYCSKCGADGDA